MGIIAKTKEELLFEMANYQKRDTGLSVNVWIDMDKTYLKGTSQKIKVSVEQSKFHSKR